MSRLIFAIQLLLIPALQATAAPDSPRDGTWSLITDGRVSFYTKGDPARAKPLLRAFSQLRDVLASASAFPLIAPAPLKVIAFQSEEEFNLYRLNAGSCAFFQQTRHSDYVVLQDLTPGHREVAMHEFTHFLLSHSGVTLPLWLNEGLADFYSTFELSGNRVTLGAPVEGRLSILHEHTALPLEKLFQVSPGSSYYSDPELMLLFYSESWAFTHMLIASPAYSPRFPDFVKALKEAHSSAEALRLAFGKTPAQVQQDLRAYLDVQHLPRLEGTLRAVHADAPASLQAVSGVEMAATLGDLLPGKNTSEEELGYQALEHGQAQEARAHFRLAVERHSSDPNVLFYLAHLDHEAGVPSSQVLPLLDRALALQPDLPDARLELALLAANDGDFARALAALQKLSAPRPENAYVAIYTEAYCFARLNHMQEARAAADRARLIARNDRDRAQVSQLLEFIADRSK